MAKYTALLLNGGVGARAEQARPKQLLVLNGKPMLAYSLLTLDAVSEIDQIVMNAPIGYETEVQDVVKSLDLRAPIDFVSAGSTRQESVYNMLGLVKHEHIILHETARPLVELADFTKLISSEHNNVSTALPLAFTAAPVDPELSIFKGYIERDALRNIQLPQKFLLADFKAAHEAARAEGKSFTEDGTMLTEHGKTVHYIEGQPRNFKITTAFDVELANLILSGSLDRHQAD